MESEREARDEEGRGAESISPPSGGSGGPDDTGADYTLLSPPPRPPESGKGRSGYLWNSK